MTDTIVHRENSYEVKKINFMSNKKKTARWNLYEMFPFYPFFHFIAPAAPHNKYVKTFAFNLPSFVSNNGTKLKGSMGNCQDWVGVCVSKVLAFHIKIMLHKQAKQ